MEQTITHNLENLKEACPVSNQLFPFYKFMYIEIVHYSNESHLEFSYNWSDCKTLFF